MLLLLFSDQATLCACSADDEAAQKQRDELAQRQKEIEDLKSKMVEMQSEERERMAQRVALVLTLRLLFGSFQLMYPVLINSSKPSESVWKRAWWLNSVC